MEAVAACQARHTPCSARPAMRTSGWQSTYGARAWDMQESPRLIPKSIFIQTARSIARGKRYISAARRGRRSTDDMNCLPSTPFPFPSSIGTGQNSSALTFRSLRMARSTVNIGWRMMPRRVITLSGMTRLVSMPVFKWRNIASRRSI